MFFIWKTSYFFRFSFLTFFFPVWFLIKCKEKKLLKFETLNQISNHGFHMGDPWFFPSLILSEFLSFPLYSYVVMIDWIKFLFSFFFYCLLDLLELPRKMDFNFFINDVKNMGYLPSLPLIMVIFFKKTFIIAYIMSLTFSVHQQNEKNARKKNQEKRRITVRIRLAIHHRKWMIIW